MITHACLIRNNRITRNGVNVFDFGSKPKSEFLPSAYSGLKIDYPKFYKMDDLSKAGFIAAEVLLAGHVMTSEVAATDVALVLSNASSSLDTDRRYAATMKSIPSPALFVYTLPNIVAGEICIRHRIKGENAFFISPNFDPVLIANYVDLIQTRLVVAGWVDVLSDRHDVFLYLLDKSARSGMPHTPDTLKEIYTNELWNN